MDTSTSLAIDRTRLAHERTLMAWVRTAVSLISFGFTIYKFFEYLVESGQRPVSGHGLGPRHFGMLMITIATITLVLAMVQHRQEMKRLRGLDPQVPKSTAFVLATFIAALGVVAMIAVVFRV